MRCRVVLCYDRALLTSLIAACRTADKHVASCSQFLSCICWPSLWSKSYLYRVKFPQIMGHPKKIRPWKILAGSSLKKSPTSKIVLACCLGCVQDCLYVYTAIYIYIYIYTHTYIYIYIYIYIYVEREREIEI